MKTSFKVLIVLLAGFFSVSLGHGQNISQSFPGNNQIPVKIDKNLLPAGFMAGLQWQKFFRHVRVDKSTHSFTYWIDTAVVYSNYINPQRYIYSYDSAGNKITTYIELTTNGEWNYVSKDTATYDSVGNQLTALSKIWKNGRWEKSSLNVNTYTVNHNVVSQTDKKWNGSDWTYSDSTHFTYDANGNKVASYGTVWSDTNNSWISSSFDIFVYDSVGNQELALNEQWDDSLWANNQMVKYTYDSASNLIRGLVQNWADTNWVNFYKEDYTYDSAGNRLSYTGEIWNDSVWVNDQHYDYTYDDLGQMETGTGENWNDSIWTYFEKGQYTYDTYGGVETYYYQKYDTTWENISLSQYNYDSVGNAYLGKYYSWDTVSKNWSQNNDGVLQIFYNYSSAVAYFTGYQVEIKYNAPIISTGIGNVKDFVSQYRCAPNPAINHTTIHLGLDTRERISVYLYSLSGEKLATIFEGELNKGMHLFLVPTAELPSGIYLASLLSGNYTKTIKLVVRK